ncbi:protoglobin domain-containing protein [Hymenobacter negativus]|uniref:Protogloblin ApPgb n=1 Tax=Hymenobacter negativus TaxID=2795026 RepID=A0ABS3QJ82_9BACT|nr:protoglobin domain-containing protein [Hymenobacter negativus]MBO2011212.1 protogloblin ApPgb [Hymenobacter negativus]
MENSLIPGYAYGQVSRSPVTLEELELLKQTVLFSDADVAALAQAGQVLAPQTNAILDVWYGFVGAHPHLLRYFSLHGQPDGDYLARVRARFGQWILDVCIKPYDQAWLDYQHEIGLRHTSAKKNVTDGAMAEPLIHLRYLTAFIVPLTATIKPFLQRGGHAETEVEAMHAAWFKAVTLTATLWSYPYVKEGQF